MGWNTTVIVMNDALDQIAKDKQFGKRLSDAIMKNTLTATLHGSFSCNSHVDVGSGNHANAATVIEQHHADAFACILVGRNSAQHLGYYYGPGEKQDLLEDLANELGYSLRKKPTPKKK